MKNERGGIISKLIIIPAGLVLMVGFFFLGYYVGRYQGKSGSQAEAPLPLPDVVVQHLPKKDEFTFFKTLTEKGDQTVSIDLKPKPVDQGGQAGKNETSGAARLDKKTPQPKEGKKIEIKVEKTETQPPAITQPAMKSQAQSKKEPEIKAPLNARLHYTIQIAAYQEKGMAEADVKKLKKLGYAAFIVSSDLPDKGTWYRVRLGSFAKKGAAERLQGQLRTKEGISSFVTLE